MILLTCLIARSELNIALFTLSLITLRRGIFILRALVLSNGSQRKTQASKPYQRLRRFWIRTGRTGMRRLTGTLLQVKYADSQVRDENASVDALKTMRL